MAKRLAAILLTAALAFSLCAALKPRIVVPMHYRSDSCGLSNVAPVEDFLSQRSDVIYAGSSALDPKTLTSSVTLVLDPDESALVK